MNKEHQYKASIIWTGNNGSGTKDYRSYDRNYTISVKNKPDISCSSDVIFRGDKSKHNPEDLFVSSLSACHMLWFLHLCADAGIIVTEYKDKAEGILKEDTDGSGKFTSVTLNPVVTITELSMFEKANELHEKANRMCFIANSCNFPVIHKPSCKLPVQETL